MADKKQDSGQACGRVQAIAHTMQRRGSVRTFYDNYKLTLGQEITFIVTEEIALTAKIKDVWQFHIQNVMNDHLWWSLHIAPLLLISMWDWRGWVR